MLPGLLFLAVMWLVYLVDISTDLELYHYGIFPREVEGLVGVIASPFLHSTKDFHHIMNNSIPLFVLAFMLFTSYRSTAFPVLLLSILGAGAFTWFFGSANYHIGASGVVYALVSYLFFSGLYRKRKRQAAVSLLVAFLYGSVIWGIFPIQEGVSWEGHLGGFLTGAILAIIFRKEDREQRIYPYEVMEKMGIEPGHNFYPPLMPDNQEEESERNTGQEETPRQIRVIYRYRPMDQKRDNEGESGLQDGQ